MVELGEEEGGQESMLEGRVFICYCGARHFEISITNGADGKTPSIWLKCSKCHAARVMRKIMKEISFGN